MATRSYFRGHLVVWEDDRWLYEDTGARAGFGFEDRPCKKCGLIFEGSNIGDADPCLGELPGADNACCGHGVRSESYVRFTNGIVLKGFFIEKIEIPKKNKCPGLGTVLCYNCTGRDSCNGERP